MKSSEGVRVPRKLKGGVIDFSYNDQANIAYFVRITLFPPEHLSQRLIKFLYIDLAHKNAISIKRNLFIKVLINIAVFK